VTFGVLIQGREHDREDGLHVVADQIAKVFVVPEIQCSLGDLEMRTRNRFGELIEEWLLDLGKLLWVHDFENIFDFIQEHDFLGAVGFGPVSQQT
jgi:hypothetical protein